MTLLVSCDAAYAKLYARAFFMSCVKAGQRLHLNLINPDDETTEMQMDMRRVAPELFESSVSKIMPNAVAYTFQRFVAVRTVLETHPWLHGYYTVDVDSIVLKALPPRPAFDLGLWLRPEESDERVKVLASLCYFSVKSLLFLRRAEEHFTKLPLEWFADQIALLRAYRETWGQVYCQDLRALGQLSWEPEDYGKAAIHQGKGPRKKHLFFVNKVGALTDEFRECVKHCSVETAPQGGLFPQSPVL